MFNMTKLGPKCTMNPRNAVAEKVVIINQKPSKDITIGTDVIIYPRPQSYSRLIFHESLKINRRNLDFTGYSCKSAHQ